MKKIKFKNLTVSIIVFTIIISSVIIYANLHIHLIAGEIFVVHGHPFSDTNSKTSPVNSHQHSSIDHFVIFSLLVDNKLITLLCVILIYLQLLYYSKQYFEKILQNNPVISYPSLRAPPLP